MNSVTADNSLYHVDGPDSLSTEHRRAGRTWFFSDVLAPFLITRLALVMVGALCLAYWSHHLEGPAPEITGSSSWITMWSRWDGVWYLRIVINGYSYQPGQECSIAFAPLYPMLMRAIGGLFGGSVEVFLWIGVFISNVSLLVALGYLYRLTEMQWGRPTARRVVVFFLLCPLTVFFSAVYPMSLMLALTTAGFYYARQQRWALAGAIAALCPVARPDGVLIVVAMAVELFRQRGKLNRAFFKDFRWLCVAPAIQLLWLAGQWLAFNDPLAFIHVQNGWPSTYFWTNYMMDGAALNLICAACFLVLLVITWLKLPPWYGAFTTMYGLLIAVSPRFVSSSRYMMVLFPIFMSLAWLGRFKVVRVAYCTASGVFAIICTGRFLLGQWCA